MFLPAEGSLNERSYVVDSKTGAEKNALDN